MEENLNWLKDELNAIEQKIKLEEYRLDDAKLILEELEKMNFIIPYGHAPAFLAGDRYENHDDLVEGVYWEDENSSISGIRKGKYFGEREGEFANVSKEDYLRRIEELETNLKNVVKLTKSDRTKLKIQIKVMEIWAKVKQTFLAKKKLEMLNAGNEESKPKLEENKKSSWVLTEEESEIAHEPVELDESQINGKEDEGR